MGKGKLGLKNTLDASLIVNTGEEVGDIPFWIINENDKEGWGVSADKNGYSLVERKEMTRGVKDESGNIIGGETYYTWQFCKSAESFEDGLLTYTEVTERKLMGKLVKCKDFRVLVAIRLQIQKTINNSFKINGVNSELLDACNTIQGHEDLKIKIAEVSKLADNAMEQCNDLIDFIKEKRKIIVHEMPKEKKHRMKLED